MFSKRLEKRYFYYCYVVRYKTETVNILILYPAKLTACTRVKAIARATHALDKLVSAVLSAFRRRGKLKTDLQVLSPSLFQCSTADRNAGIPKRQEKSLWKKSKTHLKNLFYHKKFECSNAKLEKKSSTMKNAI